MAQGGLAGTVFRACVEMLGRLPSEAMPKMTRRQMWMLIAAYEEKLAREAGTSALRTVGQAFAGAEAWP